MTRAEQLNALIRAWGETLYLCELRASELREAHRLRDEAAKALAAFLGTQLNGKEEQLFTGVIQPLPFVIKVFVDGDGYGVTDLGMAKNVTEQQLT